MKIELDDAEVWAALQGVVPQPVRARLDRFDVKVEVVEVVPCNAFGGSGVIGLGDGERAAGYVGGIFTACSRYEAAPVLRVTTELGGAPRFTIHAAERP